MNDFKDLVSVFFDIFGKRIVKITIVFLGLFSGYILSQNGFLVILGQSFDWSHLIKNAFLLFILIVLFFVTLAIVVIKIWDLFILGIQKINKQWTIGQKDKLKKSQEAKLKEELNKLSNDEKEFLQKAVIQFEKKTSSQDKWITKALEDKKLIVVVPSFNSLDERITYRVTIHDFVFNELEKELSDHIKKELNNLEDSEKYCLLDCYQEGHRFAFQGLKDVEKRLLSKKLLLVGGKSIAIIPQMVWDRLHLLQEENKTDLNKS